MDLHRPPIGSLEATALLRMPVSLDIAKVVNERPERLFFLSVSEGIAPGSAAAFLMPEGDVQVAAAGILGLDNTTPVTDETIFYIASCTEPVTSVAALQLVERGLVALNEPAERYVLPLADLDALASFIERLWRSLKFECVYLHAFETGSELRAGLGRWINYYNTAGPAPLGAWRQDPCRGLRKGSAGHQTGGVRQT